MRIAQIAPLTEAIPPKLYGGTERVVSWLTEELVALGHDVTLFASGDSCTSAKLEAMWPRALRLDDTVRDPDGAAHRHAGARAPAAPASSTSCTSISTICRSRCSRGRPRRSSPPCTAASTCRNIRRCSTPSARCPVISISDIAAQAGAAGALAEDDLSRPAGRPAGAAAVRSPAISPSSAASRRRRRSTGRSASPCDAGLPLKIAAKVDRVDRDYFEREIRPLLDLPGIEYIGEIDDAQKSAFLSGAMALLMPIDWPEPFGLVMIEAMACGTPVIAFRSGSVPEVVEHGVTGFIVDERSRRRRPPSGTSSRSCRARASAPASRSASPRAAWPRNISRSIAA